MSKTILISGINGFLASNLVALLKKEYTLYGIAKKAELVDGIEVFSSDRIEEIKIIPDFLIVCHAAVASGSIVLSNELLFEVNVGVTQRLVQKFREAKIIYVSSASIYDLDFNLIRENSTVNPKTDYAISKLWAEQIVAKTQNKVIIRVSSLFGLGMKENTIIPNYVNQALQNGIIEVWGKGERKQNYILVQDACMYIKKAIEKFELVNSQLLLVVSKTEYSNNELAQIIAEETNAKIVYINSDNSKSCSYDNSHTCKLLDWTPNPNFLAEIKKYINWKKRQF